MLGPPALSCPDNALLSTKGSHQTCVTHTTSSLQTNLIFLLPAIELVLHAPSGLVYLACSSIPGRIAWAPYTLNFERSPSLPKDYIAFYDPSTSAVRKLSFQNTYEGFEYHSHGMDVVPSKSDPNVLFVYLVNHRPQSGDKEGKEKVLGADSVIELFKTTVGGDTLTHVKTFEDADVIVTPNDISGSSDGESFFFTNDMPHKTDKVGQICKLWLSLSILTIRCV